MGPEELREEKRRVKTFYDTFGWRRNDEGTYNDTALFADLAATLRQYYERTDDRVRRYLRPRGAYFLDAGSGPVPYDNYIALSAGYRFRVCADFSELALREARSRLGDKGRYVCADITRLPFKDGVFDAVFSAHCIYHIPADEQARAISELQRALGPGCGGVIVYSTPSSWFTGAAEGLTAAKRRLERIPGVYPLWRVLRGRRRAVPVAATAPAPAPAGTSPPRLYFHAHSYDWLRGRSRPDCATDVRCFSAVDREFTRTFVPGNAVGRWLMAAIYRAEEIAPRLMARVGCYPMLVLKKPPAESRGGART
jgi:SAM-dependent methyltransferase